MRRAALSTVGTLVVAAASVACSLLVETAGLSGSADRADTDAASEPVVDAGDATTDTAPAPHPCADTTLAFCETFDDQGALARFGKDTDSTTSIAIDGPPFVTGPASARPSCASGSPRPTRRRPAGSSVGTTSS